MFIVFRQYAFANNNISGVLSWYYWHNPCNGGCWGIATVLYLYLELFPLCGIFVIFHFITIFVIYIKILRLSHISPRVINICFKISLKLIKICSKALKILV